jgi:hypothetical protein
MIYLVTDVRGWLVLSGAEDSALLAGVHEVCEQRQAVINSLFNDPASFRQRGRIATAFGVQPLTNDGYRRYTPLWSGRSPPRCLRGSWNTSALHVGTVERASADTQDELGRLSAELRALRAQLAADEGAQARRATDGSADGAGVEPGQPRHLR